MRLISPIHPRYYANGYVCGLTQLFGENKNRLFYGPKGHRGLDFQTRGVWWYSKLFYSTKTLKGYRKTRRDGYQEDGRIHLVAAHDGRVTTVLKDNKQRDGWGIFITKKPEMEVGQMVQYRTLYWHIETPWKSTAWYNGKIRRLQKLKEIFWGRKVKAGAVVAIAGDNGKSTGPHLHFSLDKRVLYGAEWQQWERIDPMPYLKGDDTAYRYHYNYSKPARWFHKGKEITKKQANSFNKPII